MYIRESNEDRAGSDRSMKKRGIPSLSQARTCTLFLQSDPMLWNFMTSSVSAGGLGYVSTDHWYWYQSLKHILRNNHITNLISPQ